MHTIDQAVDDNGRAADGDLSPESIDRLLEYINTGEVTELILDSNEDDLSPVLRPKPKRRLLD